MSKIVIFGNSITKGSFDLDKGGWAKRLEIFFWEKNYEKTGSYYNGHAVDCFGVGGDLSHDVAKRFDFETRTIHGEIGSVIFAVGINDSGFVDENKRGDEKDFKKNIANLVKKSSAIVEAKNICFVGITNVHSDAAKDWFDVDRVKEFDEIIANIADENGCNFISMYGILEDDDFCDDGLHPNAQGHKKMFERIRDFLLENNIV